MAVRSGTGLAAVIAQALRERGRPGSTAALVTAELTMPDRELSITRRCAAGQLARARWRP